MLKALFIYFSGRVLVALFPILLIPILTHNISAEDYGVIGIFFAIYQVLSIFIGVSGTGAVVRAFMDKDSPGFSFEQYLFNAILVNIILFFLALTPFYFIYSLNVIDLPFIVVLILPLIVVVSGLRQYKQKLWNIQSNATRFTIFEVSFALFSFLLAVILVLTIRPDWGARVYSIAFSELLFCAVSLYYLFKEDGVVLKLNKKYCIDVLKFGLPLMPHTIALTVIATSDKLLLSNFLGMQEVGIFTVSASISSILLVVTMALDQTLKPVLYNFFNNQTKEGKSAYVAGFYVYFLIISLCGVILYLLAPWAVESFVGEEFKASEKYIGIMLIAQVGYAMYRYVVQAIFFSKKTYLVSIASISSAILGLFLQYFLIGQYGIYGAALGTVGMFLLSFVFAFYFSNNLYPMPWNKSFTIIGDIPSLIKMYFLKQKGLSE